MTFRREAKSRSPKNNRRILLLTAALATVLLLTLRGPVGASTSSPEEHRSHEQMPMGGSPSQPHRHPAPDDGSSGVSLEEKLGDFIPLDLAFRDEDGQPVRLADLVTAPTIIAPVYYHCPNVCTFLQGGLARALPEIKLDPGKDFNVLSVSFDETETPALARSSRKTYMTAMSGRFPENAWHFLTGDSGSIRKLLDASGYHIERRGEDFLHPVVIFVVSPEGKIVRYLHGTSFLPKDLTLALMEASTGTVGTTIRKVVSFCFSYDPENKTYVFNILRVSATVVIATAGAFLAFLIFTGRRKSAKRESHD